MTDLMKNKLEKVLDEQTSPGLFVTAIEWFKKELWNDAEVLPNVGERILVRYASNTYSGRFVSCSFSLDRWVYSIQTESNTLIAVFTRKWASLKDLLPEDKEE